MTILYLQKKALDEALERGIILTQQTHWGTLAETIEETLTLVKIIKRKNFGITYEPANLLACGSDYSFRGLEKLLPYVVNFYFQNIHIDKNTSTIKKRSESRRSYRRGFKFIFS